MNKYLKKISTLATIVFLSTQSVAYAENRTSNIDFYKSSVLQLINGMNCVKNIEKNIPLYDANNNESAMLFDLDDGYVIVDELTNEVSEYSLMEDNKYFTDSNKHYVYGGPSYFYEYDNGQLKNLQTNQIENSNNLIGENLEKFRENVQKNKICNNSIKTAANNSNENLRGAKVAGRIPNLSYNPNGICGSCAAGNLLTFFSWNINSAFIPQQYRDSVNTYGNGIAFIKSIVPFVEGESALDTSKEAAGSNPNQLKEGLGNYLLKKVGFTGTVSLYDLRKNRIASIQKIKSGLPFILGLYKTGENPYGNHWVLAIGYIYMGTADTLPLYYNIVDGWGHNDVYVNTGWTDFMISI